MDYVNTIEDAFHTACRLLDVFCLSKSKNIDFRDIRYESINQMGNGNWQ
ncbi:hypothetical protein T09_10350 [Trichinella sp. T9]|nr:hypothetical protein T09_10350 [Trichinella sp. T9]